MPLDGHAQRVQQTLAPVFDDATGKGTGVAAADLIVRMAASVARRNSGLSRPRATASTCLYGGKTDSSCPSPSCGRGSTDDHSFLPFELCMVFSSSPLAASSPRRRDRGRLDPMVYAAPLCRGQQSGPRRRSEERSTRTNPIAAARCSRIARSDYPRFCGLSKATFPGSTTGIPHTNLAG